MKNYFNHYIPLDLKKFAICLYLLLWWFPHAVSCLCRHIAFNCLAFCYFDNTIIPGLLLSDMKHTRKSYKRRIDGASLRTLDKGWIFKRKGSFHTLIITLLEYWYGSYRQQRAQESLVPAQPRQSRPTKLNTMDNYLVQGHFQQKKCGQGIRSERQDFLLLKRIFFSSFLFLHCAWVKIHSRPQKLRPRYTIGRFW